MLVSRGVCVAVTSGKYVPWYVAAVCGNWFGLADSMKHIPYFTSQLGGWGGGGEG